MPAAGITTLLPASEPFGSIMPAARREFRSLQRPRSRSLQSRRSSFRIKDGASISRTAVRSRSRPSLMNMRTLGGKRGRVRPQRASCRGPHVYRPNALTSLARTGDAARSRRIARNDYVRGSFGNLAGGAVDRASRLDDARDRHRPGLRSAGGVRRKYGSHRQRVLANVQP